MDGSGPISEVSSELKNQLMRALLKVEPAVLKVLVEVVNYTPELFLYAYKPPPPLQFAHILAF